MTKRVAAMSSKGEGQISNMLYSTPQVKAPSQTPKRRLKVPAISARVISRLVRRIRLLRNSWFSA